jgi:small conductance mechanosensitive channel
MDSLNDFFQLVGATWLGLSERLRVALVALGLLLAGVYFARLAHTLTRRGLAYRKAAPEISLLVARIVQWSIVVFVILLSARQIGLDITAALAGLGILGFTLGFALQDVSKNFVAGLLILIQRPFELGDTIQVSGFTGTILDVNLRDTELRTTDGLRVRIPNGEIFTQPVLNFSGVEQRRLQITLGIGFDSDLEKVRRIVEEVIRAIPGVSADPEPAILFDSFSDYSVKMNVFYWYNERETGYGQALDAGVSGIKQAFDQKGIVIPIPVHQISMPKG